MSKQSSDFKNLKGHKPVLLKEVLGLAPFAPPGQGKTMLDATFGCGGHTKAFLDHFPELSVIAIDRDLQAIQWGKSYVLPSLPSAPRLKLYHASFHPWSHLINPTGFSRGAMGEVSPALKRDVKYECSSKPNIKTPVLSNKKFFDIILLDLGVSSLQLDQAERGFSFYKDGPLDMRMDQNQNLKARDIINQFSEQALNDIFFHYEEEFREAKNYPLAPQKRAWQKPKSHKVVQAILRERKKGAIKSTKQLADLIVKQTGWQKKGRHPATKYFLALRLKVNEELSSLTQSLPLMIKSLKKGGRILVLSFHSTEDRIVKLAFKKAKENKEGEAFKKVIFPLREEIQQNPRARSVKLRVFEKSAGEI